MLEKVLAGTVIALAGFVGVQAVGARGIPAVRALRLAAAPTHAAMDADEISRQYVRNVARYGAAAPPRWVVALQAEQLRGATPAPPRHDPAEGDWIREGADRTYISALLVEDALLHRWPARELPLRVWIQPRSDATGWSSSLVPPVRAAFRSWGDLGLGITFEPADDSSAADVHVLWAPELPGERQIGSTIRLTDEEGWIVGATITLATHPGHHGAVRTPRDTAALDIYTIQNAALHEVGHLIGLEHSPNHDDVMAAETAGRQDHLSTRDRATALLLYRLSPGPVPGGALP